MALDINQHLQQAQFGKQTEVQGGDGLANEKETLELWVEGADKSWNNAIKIAEGIPFIGWILAAILPTSPGKASAVASFETQGIAGKPISQVKGLTGGALWNAIGAPLIKNSTITDHTSGTGGGGGDYSGGGGGGGSDYTSGGGGGFIDSHSHFEGMVGGGGGNYEWSAMSMASLGALPRPITPDMGGDISHGVA